ncbi:MAG: MaoC family dehydratase [bacterium]|nr:MaoC family dehydratase [bacterium]
MAKIELIDLEQAIGHEIKTTWREVSRDLISRFAELTGDKNPIHLNAKAAQEAGFEGTIAHGYLLISLMPEMLREAVNYPTDGTIINRGIEWFFKSPVLAGDSVRLLVLASGEKESRGVRIKLFLKMEIKSSGKIAGHGFVFFYLLKKT